MTCQNQSTRSRILAAAEKLFAEKGYSETTTREIVREAGASLSSLQAHFQGKENVYFQVRSQDIEELSRFMQPCTEEAEYLDGQGLLYGEAAWNLLSELLSRYIDWCFDEKNRHAITLIGRELLDGAPVQGLPEEKIEAVFATIEKLCLRYVGAESGDWAQLVGHTVVSTMVGMARCGNRSTRPEEEHFRLTQPRAQIRCHVKNYILLTLRAYLDVLKAHPQESEGE